MVYIPAHTFQTSHNIVSSHSQCYQWDALLVELITMIVNCWTSHGRRTLMTKSSSFWIRTAANVRITIRAHCQLHQMAVNYRNIPAAGEEFGTSILSLQFEVHLTQECWSVAQDSGVIFQAPPPPSGVLMSCSPASEVAKRKLHSTNVKCITTYSLCYTFKELVYWHLCRHLQYNAMRLAADSARTIDQSASV